MATPVWASTFAPPLRTFIEENRESLKEKQIAVILCFSGGGADKALEKLRKCLPVDAFEETLVLVDPKDRPSAENNQKIGAFCAAIK